MLPCIVWVSIGTRVLSATQHLASSSLARCHGCVFDLLSLHHVWHALTEHHDLEGAHPDKNLGPDLGFRPVDVALNAGYSYNSIRGISS